MRLVTAQPSAYNAASGPIEAGRVVAGRNLLMVSGMQARNNARVAVTGSVEMFSDRFWAANVSVAGDKPRRSGNAAFSHWLVRWVFAETGVLRVENMEWVSPSFAARTGDGSQNPAVVCSPVLFMLHCGGTSLGL